MPDRLIDTLKATSQMACMPVGRRVQTCLTSALERVPYVAHIVIWDMTACTIYDAGRRQSAKKQLEQSIVKLNSQVP